MVTDHKGNEFKNIPAMCAFWKIRPRRYRARIAGGYTQEQALEWDKFLQAQRENSKHFTDCRVLTKAEEQSFIKKGAQRLIELIEEQGDKVFYEGIKLPDYKFMYRGYEEIMFRLMVNNGEKDTWIFAYIKNDTLAFNSEYRSQFTLNNAVKILKVVASIGKKAHGITPEGEYIFVRAMRDIYAKSKYFDTTEEDDEEIND